MYSGDYITQIRLVSDIYDDAGFTGTIRVGRSWLFRNWNLHGIVSAEYNSSDTNQYLYGVTDEEATRRFVSYRPRGSVSYVAEFGANYPLSRRWVYRSFLRYRQLPSDISDSPLVITDHEVQYFHALLRVF